MNQSEKEILFLEPVCTHNIWGGSRLREEFGYREPGDDIGECWGISAHPSGDGTVKNGRFAGMRLSEVWECHPGIFGSRGGGHFPLMVKIIDAREDLSLQVHPGDAYAREHENGAHGKAECWYVLDAPPNATLAVGHNARTRGELSRMIQEGRWDELIREIPVQKGDFIQIAPGTVHAIKKGLLLLETQRSSDVTYRIYDYGRLSKGKPRELHVEKGIDVITVPARPVEEVAWPGYGLPVNVLNELCACSYYRVFKLEVDGEAVFEQGFPLLLASVVEGGGTVCGLPVKKGDHFILPHGLGTVRMEGRMLLILSTVP